MGALIAAVLYSTPYITNFISITGFVLWIMDKKKRIATNSFLEPVLNYSLIGYLFCEDLSTEKDKQK